MAKILDRLPILPRDEMVFVRGEMIRIKETQIIVWLSLTARTAARWDRLTPRFPAILDTGHSHNLSIQQQHLSRWADTQPESLRQLGMVRHEGRTFPRLSANVWLHANIPGQREAVTDRQPFLLQMPRGIIVFPTGVKFPRLPLLGLRALVGNSLHLAIDGLRQQVSLRSPDWRTAFLRWLA